jgi:SAM-dependent methyltransferase
MLLGDSFHPGGTGLTLRLGHLLDLRPGMRVLDVACGHGSSAVALAKAYGCSIHGVDLAAANIDSARAAARREGLEHLVSFEIGDAERLPVPDRSFDVVVCECAFCTFPSKDAAAAEFARVLQPGGRLGLSDITLEGELPAALDTLLGWVACLADARPVDDYVSCLTGAGFEDFEHQRHDSALAAMARDVKFKLLGAEVAARLGKGAFALADIMEAKRLTKAAAESVRTGILGYALITSTRKDS